MKKLLPLFILVLAATSFSQTQKPPKGVEVKYDKFQDETTVQTDYLWTEGVKNGRMRGPEISFEYSFTGQALKADVEKIRMVIYDKCGNRYCFHDDDEIIFLIDGERSKKSDPTMGRTGSDIIAFELTRGELEKKLQTQRRSSFRYRLAKVGFEARTFPFSNLF